MKNKNVLKKVLVILACISMTVYAVWRAFFTLPTEYGVIVLICGIIMLLCEIVALAENMVSFSVLRSKDEPEMPVIPESWYPDVDVFIATHNEPLDILYKTVNGCVHLDYPDKNKVHIWLCDDGNRESVNQLATQMGVGYIGLANNTEAKAGNLNNALKKTKGELIATLDADMIPESNFLMEMVPYFFLPKLKKNENGEWVERDESEIDENYKIGFIQSPQSFYNPDLFQYNLYSEHKIPNEQDFFFREVNVSRNRNNAPIYAGSNTVISRKALEEVGGIATGTITEDFETGIHIQEAGYRCYAISKQLVHGLAPDTIDSLLSQRERWARGCIFSIRRSKLWKCKNLSFGAKITYYACAVYWWSFFRRLVFTLAPIIFALFSVPVIICEPWEMVAFWLPSYLLSIIATRTLSSEIRTTKWSNIVDTIMFPYLVVPIFLESIGVKKKKFVVTDKTKAVNNKSNVVMAIPHIILVAFSIAAIIRTVLDMVSNQSAGPIFILFWLCVNMFSLVMGIFFMLGRQSKRMSERYDAEIPITVIADKEIKATTSDISESGFSFSLTKPVEIPVNEAVDVIITTEKYSATMKAEIVHVVQLEKLWKYCFKITELNEPSKSEYYQIVYDRGHSLAMKIGTSDSVFDNISTNLKMHSTNNQIKENQRKTHRIELNKELLSDTGEKVMVENYNFTYVLLSLDTDGKELSKTMKLYPDENNEALYFDLEFKKELEQGKYLYFVLNHNEIRFNNDLENIIDGWIASKEKAEEKQEAKK